MHQTTPPTATTSAATDVPEFLSDLDGGQFERMLSVALSKCAATAVDNGKKATVKIEFSLEPIKGTHQVQVAHKLVFSHPTMTGKASPHNPRSIEMMDKETLVLSQQNQTIATAVMAIDASMQSEVVPPVALPEDMRLHDVQSYLPTRRRLSGEMITNNPDHFATYCKTNQEHGACVFVDGSSMRATARLNFGDPEEAGHADNKAALHFQQLAPYTALLDMHDSSHVTQRALAE